MKWIAMSVLILSASITTAFAQGKIYKCVEKKKTTYSESPCRENAYDQNVFVTRDENMGTVSPDRETIEATRARIREDISAPTYTRDETRNGSSTTTTTTTVNRPPGQDFDNRMICEAAANEIQAIDSAARQPSSPYKQDRLRTQKIKARQTQAQYKC